MATKLIDEGHHIILVDPEEIVPDFQDSQGRDVERWGPRRLDQSTGT